MNRPTSTVRLEFDPARNSLGDGKELRDSLSVVAHAGRNLFVASDETTTVERLTTEDGGRTFRHHATFALGDFIRLPGADDEEIDIEGMSHDGGYLWLVGSHSLKRKQPKEDDPDTEKQFARLARVEAEANRYTLARIPLARAEEGGDYELAKFQQHYGGARASLSAAQLPARKDGNALTDALRDDEHLGAFLALPGKDNGFDIEGLAVAGERVFLGLRGPVLRGWAVILEIGVETDERDASRLALKKMPASERRYRKHFLQLDGLGIRALGVVGGRSLLIMAGPTMELDGLTSVFLWPDALEATTGSLVSRKQLVKLFDLPFAVLDDEENAGKDHAEGMTLFPAGEQSASLLVVYDAPAGERRKGKGAVVADVFELNAEIEPNQTETGD